MKSALKHFRADLFDGLLDPSLIRSFYDHIKEIGMHNISRLALLPQDEFEVLIYVDKVLSDVDEVDKVLRNHLHNLIIYRAFLFIEIAQGARMRARIDYDLLKFLNNRIDLLKESINRLNWRIQNN